MNNEDKIKNLENRINILNQNLKSINNKYNEFEKEFITYKEQ